jgi:hypothetical protein
MNNAFRNEELLSSIRWYFESKNQALRNALSTQCPLSVEAQRDARLYYSQYFASLLSATELLLEKEYPHKAAFEKKLTANLSLPDFPNGEKNYLYLKELRNSIVHRGYDITSAAHIIDNRPLFIAPENVTSRNGKSTYRAYGLYILDIIKKTEDVIGEIFCSHIDEVGLMQPSIHHSEMLKHIISFIEQTNVMPEWAKKMALESLAKMDFEMIQESQFGTLKTILKEKII